MLIQKYTGFFFSFRFTRGQKNFVFSLPDYCFLVFDLLP